MPVHSQEPAPKNQTEPVLRQIVGRPHNPRGDKANTSSSSILSPRLSHRSLSSPSPPSLSQRLGGGARGRRRRLGRMARPGRGALPLPDLEGEQASNIMKIYLSLAYLAIPCVLYYKSF